MLPEEQDVWDEIVAREEPGMALRAGFWPPVLAVWQAVRHPRRSPRRFFAVIASAVILAGVAFLAVHAPAGGCRWVVVAKLGGRAHMACERDA